MMTENTAIPIECIGLTKRFSQVTALDSLNLQIHPGDVAALLGANGSGKSTTFRLLLNIYQPTSGSSKIFGTPSTQLNGDDFQQIGHIAEGKNLPKWMRVGAYLEYCSKLYDNWDQELCQRMVETFALTPEQKIKHLSRGQAMKVAVASTVPARPKLLLLDEPFSGLDVETRAQLSELLRNLAHQEGLAIVITTHDVEEVEPVANRICILKGGHLVVDEALDTYTGRHRLLLADGLVLETLPSELAAKYRLSPALQAESKIFTEHFDAQLESATRAALSDQGMNIDFLPMNMRQILTAHSLPLT